jgi:hypothetical protein
MQYYVLCYKRASLRGKPTKKTNHTIAVDIRQDLAMPEISVACVFGIVNNICCYPKTFVYSVLFYEEENVAAS